MPTHDRQRGSPTKMLTRVLAPQNRTTRADRVSAWNEARAAGLRFQPERLSGRDARYRWLDAIVASDLPPTTRLVAHSLSMHGGANGANIFPGTRRLATTSGLSERAVCEHLDVLVRRGFLNREARHGDTAGARGFRYLLNRPKVLNLSQQSYVPGDVHRGVARVVSVPTERQHSADSGAVSTDANDMAVLTHGQRIQQIPNHRPTHFPEGEPARTPEGARAQNSETEAP